MDKADSIIFILATILALGLIIPIQLLNNVVWWEIIIASIIGTSLAYCIFYIWIRTKHKKMT